MDAYCTTERRPFLTADTVVHVSVLVLAELNDSIVLRVVVAHTGGPKAALEEHLEHQKLFTVALRKAQVRFLKRGGVGVVCFGLHSAAKEES